MNSYRRFWDTGFWAPLFADWGYQNRTTALRVSAPGRFEYRSVDSAVNPYLSFAAIIKAMDGRHPAQPRPRTARRTATSTRPSRAARTSSEVPMTLGEALTALEQDDRDHGTRCRARCTGCSTTTRHDEWERYCATVSDWDVAEYLDILP